MNFLHLDRPWSRTDRIIVRIIIFAFVGAMFVALTGCAIYCGSRTQPTLFCGDYP